MPRLILFQRNPKNSISNIGRGCKFSSFFPEATMKALKRTILAATLLLAGCGGGGGSEDKGLTPTDAADACSEYCSYACDRALDCMDREESGHTCSSTCFAQMVRSGTIDEAQCESAQDTVGNMDCTQLLGVLGVIQGRALGSTELGPKVATVAN